MSRGRLLLTLGVVVAVAPLTIDMYLPAFPALQAAFGSDQAAVQLTLSFYFLGMTVGQVIYGPVSDRIGRLKPLVFGISLYLLASVACIFAPSIETLTATRMLQALGGCAGVVITRAIARDLFEPQEMARVLSTLIMIIGVAPILAPMLGAWLLVQFGWQAIFAFLAVYALACLAAIRLGLAESWKPPANPPGLADVLASYARLLRHRRFMGYALAGSMAQAGMFGYIATSSFVFIDVYGVSPQGFGMIFGVVAFGLISASQVNARLLKRYRSEVVLRRAIASNLFFGGVLLVMVLSDTGGLWGVAVPLFLAISSLGFSFPNSTAAAMAPFGDRAGMASAMLGTLQFGIAGVVSYLVGHVHDGTALPLALAISGCGACAWLLLRLLVRPAST